MTAFRHLLATVSVLAFGGVTQTFVEPAQAKVTVAEVERACEKALRTNTLEALEEFLYKYPPEKYRNEVACYALALGALDQFGPNDNGKQKDEHVPGSNEGYGG